MAANSHWSDLEFKPVNLNAMGAPVIGGSYHPLLKVRAEFRRILMGLLNFPPSCIIIFDDFIVILFYCYIYLIVILL
jgi:hypothetical protein